MAGKMGQLGSGVITVLALIPTALFIAINHFPLGAALHWADRHELVLSTDVDPVYSHQQYPDNALHHRRDRRDQGQQDLAIARLRSTECWQRHSHIECCIKSCLLEWTQRNITGRSKKEQCRKCCKVGSA